MPAGTWEGVSGGQARAPTPIASRADPLPLCCTLTGFHVTFHLNKGFQCLKWQVTVTGTRYTHQSTPKCYHYPADLPVSTDRQEGKVLSVKVNYPSLRWALDPNSSTKRCYFRFKGCAHTHQGGQLVSADDITSQDSAPGVCALFLL